jgi:predicted lipid-binding transport protein (Tim44 family)
VMIKERIAEKKTLGHLRRLAAVDPNFDWMTVKDRVTDCYHRVHSAWREEDMGHASDWMTSWYWQNQQLAHLNQWERDGLVNHCRVKSITNMRPLFVKYQPGTEGGSNGSRLVVSITAKMEDYLAERESGKIVEGKTGYADTEHVWTFILEQGKWVVSNIEEGSMSLTYARLAPEVPAVLPGEAVAARRA